MHFCPSSNILQAILSKNGLLRMVEEERKAGNKTPTTTGTFVGEEKPNQKLVYKATAVAK